MRDARGSISSPLTRVLGDPTPAETAWADETALTDLKAVCDTKGALSTLPDDDRRAQLERRLIDACPAIDGRLEELSLLRGMLEFDPSARPSAAAALAMPYFGALTEAEQPVITPAPDPAQIAAAFRFDEENLKVNELRILLANDLFRMATKEQEATERAATRAATEVN